MHPGETSTFHLVYVILVETYVVLVMHLVDKVL